MHINDDARNSLSRRLEKARVAALQYLSGYHPEDLMTIMDAIDEDLECLNCWDDENDCPEFGYSYVDLLEQLDYKAGVFMFEDEKLYDIDVTVIFATFAFVKAVEGIAILKKGFDLTAYSKAAESCIDAFDALQYGKCAEVRAEVEGKRILKAERVSERGRTNVAKKHQKIFDEDGTYVIEQFVALLESSEDVRYLEHPSRNNILKTKIKKYTIRKNGEIDLNGCSTYLFDITNLIPASSGQEIILNRGKRYIKRVITSYLKHDPLENESAESEIVNIEDEIGRRAFPRKAGAVPQCQVWTWTYVPQCPCPDLVRRCNNDPLSVPKADPPSKLSLYLLGAY